MLKSEEKCNKHLRASKEPVIFKSNCTLEITVLAVVSSKKIVCTSNNRITTFSIERSKKQQQSTNHVRA